MASPITSTFLSGIVSRLAGDGAREKSWRGACGCCCWNGAKKSPPNQPPPPPPPLRGGGAWRCGGPPKPGKLKNCAEAGPATDTRIASAVPSAINGPVSVSALKKDFGFDMRSRARAMGIGTGSL
jgi:hypothetical protein